MDKNKIKIITMLFEHGYKDEKAIMNVGIKELVEMKCFNESAMTTLMELQAAIKTNKLLAFLADEDVKKKEATPQY